MTRYLPALAPWFTNRSLPIPWLEVTFVLATFVLPVGLAIQALWKPIAERTRTKRRE